MLLQRALHLQAVSLYVQSPLPCKDLLGSIPNPLTVQHPPGACPAFNHHHPGGITALDGQHKAPRPPYKASEGFSFSVGVFIAVGSILAQTAPEGGCYAAQSGKFTTVISATAFSTV